jgi:hypothetical protein
MAVFNILDQRRENEHNPTVDVVYEVFSHMGWEEFGLPADTEDYTEWQARVSVHDAVCVAQNIVGQVTVFFYDPGWVIANYGFIVTIHHKLKRDVLIPHQMNLDLYHSEDD